MSDTIQGFFRTSNLNSCLKRLVNQYCIINKDHDYANDSNSAASKTAFNNKWPRSMGSFCSTQLEQCAQTGDYLFNLQLTFEQAESLPTADNPNFTCQLEGDIDSEGISIPLPTFMVEDFDGDGVGLGTYHEQTICIQGV